VRPPDPGSCQPIRHDKARAHQEEDYEDDLEVDRHVHLLAHVRLCLARRHPTPSGDVLTTVGTSTHDVVVEAPNRREQTICTVLALAQQPVPGPSTQGERYVVIHTSALTVRASVEAPVVVGPR